MDLWKSGGPGVKAAAEVALLGSDADVRQFLDHENEIARLSDARVETVQIFSAGGRAVREAAQTALAGSPHGPDRVPDGRLEGTARGGPAGPCRTARLHAADRA